MGGSRGGGQGVWATPRKSQVAIGYLRYSGTDTPQEEIGHISREVRMAQ